MSNTFTPPFSLFYGDKLSASFVHFVSRNLFYCEFDRKKYQHYTHSRFNLTLMCKKYLFSIIEIEKRTSSKCIKNLHLLLLDDPWGVFSLSLRQVSVIEPFFSFICVRWEWKTGSRSKSSIKANILWRRIMKVKQEMIWKMCFLVNKYNHYRCVVACFIYFW